MALTSGTIVFADEGNQPGSHVQLVYKASEIDPQQPFTRTPVMIPSVTLDGHTLYFCDECDFTLYVEEEDGEVAYSTFVPANQTAVILPADLSGTYTIEVVRGSQSFIGEIEL